MLNALSVWCRQWHMCVNMEKSQIMHFRVKGKPITNKHFMYNGSELRIVSNYRYMGLDLNDHLDYTHTTSTLAAAGSRSLGGITHTYFALRGMDFTAYGKLFDSCVVPVLNYGSEIWGYKYYQKLETILHRLMKTFLGISKSTPTGMIIGDCGLYPLRISRKAHMIKYFHKLSLTPRDRLLWKVFSYAQIGTWCREVKTIIDETDLSAAYQNCSNWSSTALTTAVKTRLWENYHHLWANDITNTSKLNLYRDIKHDISTELYVSCNFLSKHQRRMLAMCRAGTLPLEVEKGRWRGIPRHERICKQCDSGHVEDIQHIFVCPKYINLRNILLHDIRRKIHEDSYELDIVEILTDNRILKLTANYIISVMNERR